MIESPRMTFDKSFYFVRHGETDWNRNFVYQGPHDIPLNDLGLKQAHTVAEKLTQVSFSTICTSPLLRAHKTAEIISQHNTGKGFLIIRDLMECFSKETASHILSDKGVHPLPSFEKLEPHPEEPNDFIFRIKKGLYRALHEPDPLIVAHGGVCWALCRILGLKNLATPNCCLIHFNFVNDRYIASIIS